jgi:signal transduction histidine kinase
MGTLVSGTTDDAAPAAGRRRTRRQRGPQHAAPAGPRPADEGHDGGHHDRGLLRRMADTVVAYLPRGNTLDDQTFSRRHRFLCWVLALHVPALFAFGVARGYDPVHVAVEMSVPLACLAFARLGVNRRVAAFFVTAGLVYCSSVLVHLSGGSIEAHFHFFILIGLIALYQDWVPFLWNVIFTVLSHGVGSTIGAQLMFNHDAGQARPWTWAALHGAAVLAACVGVVIFWKHTEQEQERNVQLVADIAAADAKRRVATSELLVNLARRNQSLLSRQLEVIADLERRERHPDVLEELFRLDHLATRIRRNAESLLVLSGDEPARRWGTPVPLSDVVRAAAAEIEDYRRVEVLVSAHIQVTGRAVADLAHLLAELIENATTFTPPDRAVRVRSQAPPDDPASATLSIEDQGIGMTDRELAEANALLAEAPEVDLGRQRTLGFHVVARLSQRYGLVVRLVATPGGGVTALVTLPGDLVSERRESAITVDRGGGLGTRLARIDARSDTRPEAVGVGVAGPAGPGVDLLDPPAPIPAVLPAEAPGPAPVVAPPPPPPPPPPAPTPTPAPAPAPAAAPATAGEPELVPAAWWWESEAFVRPPPAEDPAAAPPAAPTAGGLARRTPGSHLAPALRRNGATGDEAPVPPGGRDRAQAGTMLSRFQASQRAGRAAADSPRQIHPRSPREHPPHA